MRILFLSGLIALGCLWPGLILAQNPEQWQEIKFDKPEDFKANEGVVLECARFILDVAAEAGNPARKTALSKVAEWMSGTPDHTFIIGEHVGKLMSNNEAILGIYMAAMTRFVLENGDKPTTPDDIQFGSFKTLLEYCEEPRNKVPSTRELKKAIKAKNAGKLKNYLSS